MDQSPGNRNPLDMNRFFSPKNRPPNPVYRSHSPFRPPFDSPSASYSLPYGPFSNPHQMPPFHNFYPQDQQRPSLYRSPSPLSLDEAQASIKAWLAQELSRQTPPPYPPSSSGLLDFTGPANVPFMSRRGTATSVPIMPRSKLMKERHLVGDSVGYNVDGRSQGEVQPQLEVTPITKYGSGRKPVLGRRITLNKLYMCYEFKQGSIRVLNINTALKSLLRGHNQRVTDLAFFAEDVHLLASVGIGGRVYVWRISEGTDEEDKPQITERIIVAIQFVVQKEEVANPRICWHCNKQEVLIVSIGTNILRIDTTKVGIGESHVAEKPFSCPVYKPIDGVQLVGTHDREVTDLSMCPWMTNHLVSASLDGTIKFWEDCKAQPLAVLRPHDGHPVYSSKFLSAPHRPDHIVLLTAGPAYCELKLWASASENGWLLPCDAEAWKCTQQLLLKSSVEPSLDDAVFNQVAALSQADLLLLANTKRNAIYAVHLEYNLNPESTRMDCICELTVTMPVVSLTGKIDISSHGEHIVQVYCVQPQIIQQYDLNLVQCLPPPQKKVALEKSDSSVSRDAITAEITSSLDFPASRTTEISSSNSAPKTMIQASSISESAPEASYTLKSDLTEAATLKEIRCSGTEAKSVTLAATSGDADIVHVPPLPLPLSPSLSSNFKSGPTPGDHDGDLPVNDYSVDRQMDALSRNLSDVPPLGNDSKNDEKQVTHDDISSMLNPSLMFEQTTHLVTPLEIIKAGSSSETNVTDSKNGGGARIQNVVVNIDVDSAEVEDVFGLHVQQKNIVFDCEGNFLRSQDSALPVETVQGCFPVSGETFTTNEPRQVDRGLVGSLVHPPNSDEDGLKQVFDSSTSTEAPQLPLPYAGGMKEEGNDTPALGPSSSPSACHSADLYNELSGILSLPSAGTVFPQILAMQRTITQLLTMQKDIQKLMTIMVAVVTKEGGRLEAALEQSMEKAVNAHTDTLWGQIKEKNAKNKKLLVSCIQEITGLISNFINKDLPPLLEKTIKKEMGAVGPAIGHAVLPAIEKTISSAIVESFQRGVGDKTVNQLEKSVNSKIEATAARQIQVQFQTTGKQVLQEAFKSSFETSVVPAFGLPCKAMFEHVDAAFQKGMVEHSASVQQHLESGHTSLAMAMRDAINSASSFTQTLSRELAEVQRLLALAAAGANSGISNALPNQLNSGPLTHEKVEVMQDPKKELARLISECKYEEAFTGALQRNDVSILSWLCSEVDLQGILSMVPPLLSQGVVLSLLQQLACDVNKDTSQKLTWITRVAAAIDPTDPVIAMHVRPVLEQLYHILDHQRCSLTVSGPQLSSIRLLLHVVNSMLMTCK